MPGRSDREKRVTIDQVAAQAGVSKTTVSRYLNGHYGALSSETRERVEHVIRELNYRPNRMAQGLKAQNSRLLGCLVSDISSPFSALIVKGINSVCLAAGYQLLLVDSGDDPDRELQGIQGLLENQVDGLIVNTTGRNDEYLLSLNRQGIPLVLADRCLSAAGMIDTVATENYHSTYQCITYLKMLGYDHVAFFAQSIEPVSPRVIRFQAYSDALRDHFGEKGKDFLFQFHPDNKDASVQMLDEFRYRFPGQRLAAFAVNGVALLGLIQGVQAAGITMGAQFGVCGFDDWGWAELIPPGITTISQNSWMVGRRSAELLMERISGEGPQYPVYEELSNRLEIRGSTTRR